MSEPDQTNEIVPVEPTGSGIASLGDVMSTQQLRASTKKAQEQRAIITEYVRNHLVKGTDYGQIGSFKKDVLFKPGQEKIFSLMNLTSRLDKDSDTLEMLGNEKGIVAYICRVYRMGEEIAQGRGAAKVGENSRDINSTIKIAEKRARMDACLSLGFSEFFTQDLEDPEYRDRANGDAGPEAPRPASDKQKQFIMDLFKQKGITNVVATIKANGVVDTKAISATEASELIEKLKNDTYARADAPAPAEAPSAPEEPAEGEIVDEAPRAVDQQFKDDVELKFVELGMNTQDRMRFFRDTTGQPFAPKTEEQWRTVDKALDKVAIERQEEQNGKA